MLLQNSMWSSSNATTRNAGRAAARDLRTAGCLQSSMLSSSVLPVPEPWRRLWLQTATNCGCQLQFEFFSRHLQHGATAQVTWTRLRASGFTWRLLRNKRAVLAASATALKKHAAQAGNLQPNTHASSFQVLALASHLGFMFCGFGFRVTRSGLRRVRGQDCQSETRLWGCSLRPYPTVAETSRTPCADCGAQLGHTAVLPGDGSSQVAACACDSCIACWMHASMAPIGVFW